MLLSSWYISGTVLNMSKIETELKGWDDQYTGIMLRLAKVYGGSISWGGRDKIEKLIITFSDGKEADFKKALIEEIRATSKAFAG